MNYEQTMTLKEVEYELIEWAGNDEEGDDLLPIESAFFSSLCSGFGPLLTVGDTPTE